jgi:hypothetical protein
MRFPGFIGPSYSLQSVNVDAQRAINLYLEMNEAGTGAEGEPASYVGTPGLRLLATLPTGPVRGTYTDTTGQLWAVGGNTLYQVSALWAWAAVGTLSTSLGPVSIKDNGSVLVVVDGPYGYSYDFTAQVFAQISDPTFLGASQAEFMDGYLIFIKPGSQNFFNTKLRAITFTGLDVGTVEGSPDSLTGMIECQEYLYFFGSLSLEIFQNVGNANPPFQRVPGALIEIGCDAGFSIAKIQNQVFWLGRDATGRGVVYRAQGFQPERISNFAVETVIASLGDLSSARAYTYSEGGHAFYVLNLPGAQTTWAYDVATGMWHERAYLSQGAYQRHPADCHAFAYNTNVVGDYSSGNIYALDPNVYTDNGNPIVRERSAPHISQERKFLSHYLFELELETGVGTNTGQGAAPQVALQWSNDGGHTWSSERTASIGAIGARKTRARFTRLGMARDRVYRVRISDPVKVTLIGAQIEIEEEAS